MLLSAAYFLAFFVALGLAVYQDVKYTIVDDRLTFFLFWLSLLWSCSTAETFLIWTAAVLALYFLYRKLRHRELLYPYAALCLLSLLAFAGLVLGMPTFELCWALFSFAAMAYYLKVWALGDIFMYTTIGNFIAQFLPFAGLPFRKFLLSMPFQFFILLAILLSYLPYLAFLQAAEEWKRQKLALLTRTCSAVAVAAVALVIVHRAFNLLYFLPVLVACDVLVTYYARKLPSKLFFSLLILEAVFGGAVLLLLKPRATEAVGAVAAYWILDAAVAYMRRGMKKVYVRVDQLCDGDIPGFYLARQGEQYVYSEEQQPAGEILIRKKNPNGLYPEQLRLLRQLAEEGRVPQWLPIYKGTPMLPAFFLAALAAFIFFKLFT
ncbi:MAG: hypothetical protein GXO42_00095 [bacterium]|nr:hypothetical protein [bacterium]